MPDEPNDPTKHLPLRGGRTDPPFDQLQPGQAKINPMPDDQPFTQPGVTPGSGDGGGGPSGDGLIPNIIIVFNGTASYCDLAGNITGPV